LKEVKMEKISTNLGIYLGILHPFTGKLLLIRRTGSKSIIPNVSFKGNWELPGGAVMATDAPAIPYNYYLKELSRLLKEKTGMEIELLGLQRMYSVMFKGPAGYDYASVIPLITDAPVTVGEGKWVSPKELAVLAEEFEPADEKIEKSGKGLVSGTGKRMDCMAIAALKWSPNDGYADEATQMLDALIETW
jgi:hypothetical protein